MKKNLELKEEIYQKNKQAEIGNLIANISHQWREPLSKLSSINLLLISKLKTQQHISTDQLLQKTIEIEETIDFMSNTMKNFLLFYKKTDLKTTFSITESIYATLNILETTILDNKIEIIINTHSKPNLFAIQNEWMQVWLNLFTNSIKIFKERKIVNPKIIIMVNENNITISDNGGGMENNSSNGLGHKMCISIIKKYNSSIKFENKNDGLFVYIEFNQIKVN